MKKYFLLLCTIIITVVTGCSKDSPIDNEVPNPIQKGFTVTITGDSLKGNTRSTAARVELNGGYATGAGLYDPEAQATVTAIPYDGYVLDSFVGGPTDNPSKHSGASTYTFYINGKDYQFHAEFKKLFTITAQASPGGSVSPLVQKIKNGKTCTVVATPNASYEFIGWYEGSAQVSTNATYTFTVSSSRTLTAKFIKVITVIVKGTFSNSYYHLEASEYVPIKIEFSFSSYWDELDDVGNPMGSAQQDTQSILQIGQQNGSEDGHPNFPGGNITNTSTGAAWYFNDKHISGTAFEQSHIFNGIKYTLIDEVTGIR